MIQAIIHSLIQRGVYDNRSNLFLCGAVRSFLKFLGFYRTTVGGCSNIDLVSVFSWSLSHYKCHRGNLMVRCSARMIWTTTRWQTDEGERTSCSENSRIWWHRGRGKLSSGGSWNSGRRRMCWRGPRKSEYSVVLVYQYPVPLDCTSAKP